MTPTRILYVDDDPDIRHIVELSLSLDPSLQIRAAASGEEALAAIDDGSPPPQVVLVDMMMPGMDGLALLAHLRERPATAAVPVVFMTARGRQADLDRYHAAGAAGVIVKPFDPLTLADRIREVTAANGS